jgi:uncharacterized membrane protein
MHGRQNEMVCCIGMLLTTVVQAQDARFIPIGNPSQSRFASYARDISADGLTVVGWRENFYGSKGFRWSEATGLSDLAFSGSNRALVHAQAVNADGTIIVGSFRLSSVQVILRWVGDAQPVVIGPQPGDPAVPAVYGISDDGLKVVGTIHRQSGNEASIWNSNTGFVSLGHLDGADGESMALAMSGDAATVVGTAQNMDGNWVPFVWTDDTGMVEQTTLPGAFWSTARAVSADGRWLSGYSLYSELGAEDWRAVRWDAAGVIEELGVPTADGHIASAVDMSADGSTIIGFYEAAETNQMRTFIWSNRAGMRDLAEVMRIHGAAIEPGWYLSQPAACSADGRVIVGSGYHLGSIRGWVAILPPLCSPDMDDNGLLDLDDLQLFFGFFASGNLVSDFTNDGILDFFDVQAYLNLFAAGCP